MFKKLTLLKLAKAINKIPPPKREVFIPVIFQVASLLAALVHPSHIVIYAPGDSLPCRRDAS
ncbi:hypothetical protein [Photorhabdus laumondii]|uniref:Uncharacterized protein n=1 Tax=Photorhabdus laumondii subsp. clarkei TaxID=2029685 RepID=A0A329VFZ8_9GAMM|nr:hypothetical protein [Photorhabdus laumondii]RAW90818.1 hypothetical protein CKY01_11475 [Photorhabdus laumondii subsp. clarkei]